jgi:hypothetical protein
MRHAGAPIVYRDFITIIIRRSPIVQARWLTCAHYITIRTSCLTLLRSYRDRNSSFANRASALAHLRSLYHRRSYKSRLDRHQKFEAAGGGYALRDFNERV